MGRKKNKLVCTSFLLDRNNMPRQGRAISLRMGLQRISAQRQLASIRFAEAKAFAESKGIELTAVTYIGLEDFTDFEMQ